MSKPYLQGLLALARELLLDGTQVHGVLDDFEVVGALAVLHIHRLQERVCVFLQGREEGRRLFPGVEPCLEI